MPRVTAIEMKFQLAIVSQLAFNCAQDGVRGLVGLAIDRSAAVARLITILIKHEVQDCGG